MRGQSAVAATCLHWNTEVTVDDIAAAMAIGTEFTEANLTTPYSELGSPEFIEIAQQVGPSMLGKIFLIPGELWVALFAVVDDGGEPPGGPGGPGTPTAPPATEGPVGSTVVGTLDTAVINPEKRRAADTSPTASAFTETSPWLC